MFHGIVRTVALEDAVCRQLAGQSDVGYSFHS